MVRDGRLLTPGPTSNILESVTRDTLLTLYREMTGEPAEVREVDRSELYLAEEAFICGTGQEIIPVISIDRLPVGDGQPGSLTRRLQARYFDVVRGASGDHATWRTVI
jgi:branched-chain amino acid aminotransferase